MVQIGNIPEIIEVKECLQKLQEEGLIEKWELPYENLLTRRNAAIFFLTPSSQDKLDGIWDRLREIEDCEYKQNAEQLLSKLAWQVQFGHQENA